MAGDPPAPRPHTCDWAKCMPTQSSLPAVCRGEGTGRQLPAAEELRPRG